MIKRSMKRKSEEKNGAGGSWGSEEKSRKGRLMSSNSPHLHNNYSFSCPPVSTSVSVLWFTGIKWTNWCGHCRVVGAEPQTSEHKKMHHDLCFTPQREKSLNFHALYDSTVVRVRVTAAGKNPDNLSHWMAVWLIVDWLTHWLVRRQTDGLFQLWHLFRWVIFRARQRGKIYWKCAFRAAERLSWLFNGAQRLWNSIQVPHLIL